MLLKDFLSELGFNDRTDTIKEIRISHKGNSVMEAWITRDYGYDEFGGYAKCWVYEFVVSNDKVLHHALLEDYDWEY